MKKMISVILAAALLIRLVTAAYAERAAGYTPNDIIGVLNGFSGKRGSNGEQ